MTGAGARVDLLIAGGRVACPATGWRPVEASVAVADGRIVRLIAPADPLPPARETLAAAGGLVVPGLVNAHGHSPEALARGMATDAALDGWLAAVWPGLDAMPVEAVRLAVALTAAELVRGGVTGVVDHFRHTPMTDAALDAALDAWAETGMRVCVAVMLRDGLGADGRALDAPHLGTQPDPEVQIGRVLRAARRWGGHPRMRLALGPSSLLRSSDRMLAAIAEAAAASGLAVHVHLAETRGEVEAIRARFGAGPAAVLDRFGLLGPGTTCAHGVWLDAEDRRRLAGAGAGVVHNPVSNLRLGSGIADVPAMLADGVPVALGTDGAASNDGLDLWEAVKLACLLPRRGGAVEPVAPREALAFATTCGAPPIGHLDPLAGRLEAGAPADLQVLDPLDGAFLASPGGRVDATLALGGARRPRHVVAAGQVLRRDHVTTTIDEAGLPARVDAHFGRLAP